MVLPASARRVARVSARNAPQHVRHGAPDSTAGETAPSASSSPAALVFVYAYQPLRLARHTVTYLRKSDHLSIVGPGQAGRDRPGTPSVFDSDPLGERVASRPQWHGVRATRGRRGGVEAHARSAPRSAVHAGPRGPPGLHRRAVRGGPRGD